MMMQRSCLQVLLSLTLTTLTATQASAEILCHVSDPKDPTLNVRESPRGRVVNQLPNERVVRIDPDGSSDSAWVRVSGMHQGKWVNWGWVFRSHLNCKDVAKLPRERVSVQALNSAGIVPQNASGTKPMPVSCDIVPNGWGVTLSSDLYKDYQRRGFSNTAICLGLGSNDVHYDPATVVRENLRK